MTNSKSTICIIAAAVRKSLYVLCALLLLSSAAAAQSGVGGLKGFVASGFKNGSKIENGLVELRAIENHSHTKTIETASSDRNGRYEFEVSFGYYLLTISATGYATYQTKVYIPSSVNLEWATILEKLEKPTKPTTNKGKSR